LREVVESDYLPYPSPLIRQQTLDTFRKREMELDQFEGKGTIDDSQVDKLDKAQLEVAIHHWKVMSNILPARAWAMY
jgi:hypothetical protein